MSDKAERKWYRLDNAAKMIPGTVRGANTRVFRIVCELNEEINPEFLQEALDEAMREFPYFNCILRKGLFWYYLDTAPSKLKPRVTKDNLPPCAPIYVPGKRNLLFRISYFEKRVNLEMFHVLSDGTGAFMFLRRIIIDYLRLVHDIPKKDRADRSSVNEKTSDDFNRYYTSGKGTGQIKSLMSKKSFQIKGVKDPSLWCHLLEGTLSTSKFMEAAHSYNTTAGVFITAVFIKAVLETMTFHDLKHPIMISVPVDLRQFFPSVTARNFWGAINISYQPNGMNDSLEDIIAFAAEAFKNQLSKEKITETMNSYSSIEKNVGIKMIPLFLKELGIGGVYYLTSQGTTATVSNIGKITMPDGLDGYVKQFSAFMASSNMQVTITTYKDNMCFGFCSPFEETDVILNFFRILSDKGLEVVIASNDCDPKDFEKKRKKDPKIQEKKEEKRKKTAEKRQIKEKRKEKKRDNKRKSKGDK